MLGVIEPKTRADLEFMAQLQRERLKQSAAERAADAWLLGVAA